MKTRLSAAQAIENMSQHITATEAAAKWGITPRAVRALIQRGRIQGAELVIRDGRTTWIMPDQPKPSALPPGPKPKA